MGPGGAFVFSENRPNIAFALDFATLDEAREAAREVSPSIGMLKVGLELFVREGKNAVALGRELGLPVFLDLKLHDIPETVTRAVAQIGELGELGAQVVTVHASGGRAMLRGAVRAARAAGKDLAVCAVTVLTSLDEADLVDVGFDVTGLRGRDGEHAQETATRVVAERLAKMAWEEGVRWFVCSPLEVRNLRDLLGPEAVLVTPGVRPLASTNESATDQKRVSTPENAVRDGASWLVVGRPIRDADDRLAAARAIAASMEAARADVVSGHAR